MRISFSRRENGFVLIELLISVAILATIFSVIFGVFFNILSGKDNIERTGETYQNLRTIFEIMEGDIRSAVLFKGKFDYLGDPNSIKYCCFQGQDREEGGEGMDSLSLITLKGNSTGSLETDQRYIEYKPEYFQELKSSVFFRRELPYGNKFPDEVYGDERVDLGLGLFGVNLRYYDQNRWFDAWIDSDKKKLPEAVEIELTVKDRFGERKQFTYVVKIEGEKSAT